MKTLNLSIGDRVKVIANPALFRPGMIGTVKAINWELPVCVAVKWGDLIHPSLYRAKDLLIFRTVKPLIEDWTPIVGA